LLGQGNCNTTVKWDAIAPVQRYDGHPGQQSGGQKQLKKGAEEEERHY
jgi:hypothetical protein